MQDVNIIDENSKSSNYGLEKQISELNLPEKIKSKGRPKTKGPLLFKKKGLINSNLDHEKLKKMLLGDINQHDYEIYKLDDEIIVEFLSVFRKNTKSFDFIDPLLITEEHIFKSCKSKLYVYCLMFQI